MVKTDRKLANGWVGSAGMGLWGGLRGSLRGGGNGGGDGGGRRLRWW
jgi:hypothetical protein